jgi:hypothetical protein
MSETPAWGTPGFLEIGEVQGRDLIWGQYSANRWGRAPFIARHILLIGRDIMPVDGRARWKAWKWYLTRCQAMP